MRARSLLFQFFFRMSAYVCLFPLRVSDHKHAFAFFSLGVSARACLFPLHMSDYERVYNFFHRTRLTMGFWLFPLHMSGYESSLVFFHFRFLIMNAIIYGATNFAHVFIKED